VKVSLFREKHGGFVAGDVALLIATSNHFIDALLLNDGKLNWFVGYQDALSFIKYPFEGVCESTREKINHTVKTRRNNKIGLHL